MDFYIFKDYYENGLKYGASKLNEKISVIKYWKWLFECLSQYGKIIPIERNIKPEKLPKNKTQISQVQELVNLGYLVSDTHQDNC